MYFVFLNQFLFELSCKNTHTHTQTHTHTDSNEYPIVAFSKNATIIIYLYRVILSAKTVLHKSRVCNNVSVYTNKQNCALDI